MNNSKIRLLIVGSSGFIGQYLMKLKLQYDSIFTYYSNQFTNGIYFDLKEDNLSSIIVKKKISHVLFLGGIVNFSEINKNIKNAEYINVDCTTKRIHEVINSGAVPVFFSSESVFSGKRGNYGELDNPNPIFEYGFHKFTVENFIKKNTDQYYILRLSKVFASEKEPKSLVTSWLSQLENNEDITVAIDNIFCPIHIIDVKNILESLIGISEFGIYHLCSSKAQTRSDMLDIVMKEYSKYKSYKGSIIRKKLHDIKGAEMLPINTSMLPNKVENITGYRSSDCLYWGREIVKQYFL